MAKTINIDKAEEINITINGMKELQNLEDYLKDINSSLNDIADAFKEWEDIDTSVISKTFDAITVGAASIQILTTNIKDFGTVGSIFVKGLSAIAESSIALPIAALAALALVAGITYMLSPLADANKLIDEQAEAWKRLEDAQNSKMNGDLAQISNAETMLDKLRGLTDGNNQYMGSLSDAEYYIKNINDALGTNIQIDKDRNITYNDSVENIQKLIDQKKALAVVEALEPMYKEAIVQAYELENSVRKNNIEIANLQAENEKSVLEGANEYQIQMNEFKIAQLKEANEKYQEELNTRNSKVAELDNIFIAQQTGASDTVLEYVGLTGEKIKDSAETTSTDTNTIASQGSDDIKNTVEQKGQETSNVAENNGLLTISGFLRGLGNATDNNREGIVSILTTPLQIMTKEFGIHSPSTVFEGYGENIIEGLNIGISETTSDTDKEMRKMCRTVTGAFDGADLPRLKGKFHDESVAGALRKVAELFGFSTTPRLDVIKAASGGLIEPGQFFLAREAGPELVGTIGGKTAVMNNNQIVESVSEGVYRAVITAMGSKKTDQPLNITLQVGETQFGKVAVNAINSLARVQGKVKLAI